MILEKLVQYLDPVRYINSLNQGDCYTWQEQVLLPEVSKLLLLAARQSGKSTIVAGLAAHMMKTRPGSLTVIIAPTKDQSEEMMIKIKLFIRHDRDIILSRSSQSEIEMESTGSRVLCLPGTEGSSRGYSSPALLIMDEVAWYRTGMDEEIYTAVTPMQTGVKEPKLILLTTPHGKTGKFWDLWDSKKNTKSWSKIMVIPTYGLSEDKSKLVKFDESMLDKEYMEKRGIKQYFSPRHTKEFLQDKLDDMPYQRFQQEFLCEFLEISGSLFDMDYLLQAFTDDVEPMFTGEPSEIESSQEALTL